MTTRTRNGPPLGALHLPKLPTDLDGQKPWPGLEGYREGDHEFFKGREKQVGDLYRLVRRQRLTLLYGKAGTGKTSLIRAGLFPKQRKQEALPVWVRLEYTPDAPALRDQVKAAIHAAAQEAEIEAPPPDESETLWEYLHVRDGEFWSVTHRIIMPFIVFDQFEELFTHGMVDADETRAADIRAFRSELADLAEDRVPAPLHEKENEARREACNLERHHYKLLICMQEEHLADLDRMRDDFPAALFHNRMRLADLTEKQATEIVQQTGKAVGADDLCDEIVGKASEATQEQGRQSELGVPKESVNPALLAVLCTTLNQKRKEAGAPKIVHDHLAGVGKDILTEYYERQIESLPELPDERRLRWGRTRKQEVNDRIADEFVDGEVRRSITPDRARTVFGDAAMAKLVADKVLGFTPQGRVELLHDVLPKVVGRTQKSFLREWAERLAGWIVPGVVAALLVAAVTFFLGFEYGKRQRPEVNRPYPRVAIAPQTRGEAVAVGEAFMRDLNEGTRRVQETVGYLDGADFASAGVSLGYLRRFVEEYDSIFCGGASEVGSAEKARVDSMIVHACNAVRSQEAQRVTLDRLVYVGREPALIDPVWRDEVVGEWRGHEGTFNREREAINRILGTMRAEDPSGR